MVLEMIDIKLTVSFENCVDAREKSTMLYAIAERMDTGVMEKWTRRVPSACDASYSRKDVHAAMVLAFANFEDIMGSMDVCEEDEVRILLSAKILDESKRLLAQGNKIERGEKWEGKGDFDKKTMMRFCVSVMAKFSREFKECGGKLVVELDTWFDKNNNPALTEFKKIKGLDSSRKYRLYENTDLQDRPFSPAGELAEDLEDIVGDLDYTLFDMCVDAYLEDKRVRRSGGYGFRYA